jgi:hypothetical protein
MHDAAALRGSFILPAVRPLVNARKAGRHFRQRRARGDAQEKFAGTPMRMHPVECVADRRGHLS